LTDEDLIERLVHEAYAAFHILTNMGFEPEEAQACLRQIINADPPGLHVCMVLERGDRQFVFHIQPVTESQGASFQHAWLAFAAAKPGMSRAALDKIVHGTATWAMKTQLLWALEAKGFELHPGRMVH
jgi:hypothetical protein